ncbi:predicted protein [Plenodomus lingam JN3]|uniref:SNF2 N-terminal domain-containing protein n=1 Tax=Leptosphaeria maculans (strain JN3 / isolate v23.1.3 / race Av1-4-5-6-7-8) TaxID=985895 RepID=E5A718_LEPMJ|nr:predicted protein [Plenodomus lingam JN3]CBX99413.1 predicted protein [Plenodomus lingam JN3]
MTTTPPNDVDIEMDPPSDMEDEAFEDDTALAAQVKEHEDALIAQASSREDRYKEIPHVNGVFSELKTPCVSRVRSAKDICRSFGYSNPADLVHFLERTRIATDITEFNETRLEFCKKQELDKLPRPELPHILTAITRLNAAGGDSFNMSAQDMRSNPPSNLNDIYAIACNRFASNWFRASNAPLRGHPIPPALYMDRVNALLKFYDRKKGGIYAVNAKRQLKHVAGRSRTIEAVQQSAKDTEVTPSLPSRKQAGRDKARVAAVAKCHRETQRLQREHAELEKAQLETALEMEALDAEGEHAHTKERDDVDAEEKKRLLTALKQRHDAAASTLANIKRSSPHGDLDPGMIELVHPPNVGLGDMTAKSKAAAPVDYTASQYTKDESNPRASWFFQGLPIGITEAHMDELLDFDSTCFECETCELGHLSDPTFTVGGHDARSEDPVVAGGQSAAEITKTLSAASLEQDTDNGDADVEKPLVETTKADLAAAELSKSTMAQRMSRLTNMRKVTSWEKVKTRATIEAVEEPSFSTQILMDKAYEGIELSADGEEQLDEAGDAADAPSSNINDPSLRLNVETAVRLMDNAAYQPKDYEKALNVCQIAHRKNPRIPGQNPNGHSMLWWQTTGAAEGVRRREAADALRASQLMKLIEANDPNALAKSEKGVPQGIIYADEVGIGKTDTYAAQCLIQINRRKLDLLTMMQAGDIEALESYPAPKPHLMLTQPHLVTQMASALANFSSMFKVFIYGARSNSDPAGITRIVERLTRDSPFFNPKNELNSQVFIVCAYPTFHVRHGPAAVTRYLRGSGSTKQKAHMNRFELVRRKGDSEWRPDFELDELFSEICLDEAQNTKGMFLYHVGR